MKCAWNDLMSILPQGLRQLTEAGCREDLQELRLRVGKSALAIGRCRKCLNYAVNKEDIAFIINAASRYSPWTVESMRQGYLTAPGGHRIGVCGEAVVRDGNVMGIRNVTSLCIRVARDFQGIATGCPAEGNLLLLGPPGSGKSTLLRDLIRCRSRYTGSVAVVDERGELFPRGFDTGENTDVLQGCGKVQGIQMVLRTMGPSCIAVDEITDPADCAALSQAQWCGVEVLATVHAASISDLRSRKIYRSILEGGLFSNVLVLLRDKSWHIERNCL